MFNITDISITPQSIHVAVKVTSPPSSWFLSIVYASPHVNTRKSLWDQLSLMVNTIASNFDTSWLVGGDFNEILIAHDKHSGNLIMPSRVNLFWNCVNHCKLVDLGFKGSKYTWTNKRYRH